MVFGNQKHTPKEISLHILTLDCHYILSKVKINESLRLKSNENIFVIGVKKLCVCPKSIIVFPIKYMVFGIEHGIINEVEVLVEPFIYNNPTFAFTARYSNTRKVYPDLSGLVRASPLF